MARVATAQPTTLREMIEDPGWQQPAETRTWERGLCGICPSCCAVRVEKTDGRIGRVVPDKDSPMGYICKLGVHSADIVYADARLRYPMKRVGKKGGYEFERIGWDEAFDHIVHRLTADKEAYGPESVGIYTGRGSFDRGLCEIFQPKGVAVSSASSVLFPFGSPNSLGVGALCYVSFAMIAPHVTMGRMLINTFFDIENAGLVVVWGANPATDSPPADLQRIKRAKARGAEVVVIDPRRSKTAQKVGAEWIPVRPGSDGALALALCWVMIEEELYDEEFVANYVHGFDEFVQYAQHYRPETVESITGVPAERIRVLARRIAEANGATPVMYTGLEYSDSGVQAIRAVMTLWALAGQLDVPGGYCFSMAGNEFPLNRAGLVPNPNPKRALGRDRFPIYSHYRGESHGIALPESVLEGRPYRIRSLIVVGASLITSWPQTEIWRRTLGALDFLVCVDRQLTADAAYADIVLPAATGYEVTSFTTYGPIFRIREKVVDPVGEARSDHLILTELARRFGYGDRYPQTEEDALRYVLEGSGFTLEEVRAAGGQVSIEPVIMQYKKWDKGLLRPDGVPGFDTPTGKFEILSTVLEEHGYEGLPVYTEPGEGPLADPQLAQRFPLVFNSGSRVSTDFRSQFHGVAGLTREMPEPVVTLNDRDAARRGIETGDRVEVRTPRGAVHYRAFVTEDIIEGATDAHMGGGGPVGNEAWQTCNVNELTDLTRYDPISGFPVYKSLLCDVVKIGADEGASVTAGEEASDEEVGASAQSVEPKRAIYLDNNATTPTDPAVLKTMHEVATKDFGNPSSIHTMGVSARRRVEDARRQVAQLLGCTARRVVFTGSGSEADNLAIKGVALGQEGGHFITSNIEHDAVRATMSWLSDRGYDVSVVEVNGHGIVQPDALRAAIRPDTRLVSIMMANNEIGTVQPVEELARIAHDAGALFHTDAVQATGKLPIDVEALGVDLLALSGHKLYGPKGVGALYVAKGVELCPLVHGGHQEGGHRAGTENVAAIVGLGVAAELAERRMAENDSIRKRRDQLLEGLSSVVPKLRLNGHLDAGLPNTVNVTLPGLRGESMVYALSNRGIAVSSGSACRAGNAEPSHALLALGLSEEQAHCALRFSLGRHTTEEEIDLTIEAVGEVIESIGQTVRFVACR